MKYKLYIAVTLLNLLLTPIYAKELKFGSPNLPPGACDSTKCMAGAIFANSIEGSQNTVSFLEMPFIRIVIFILTGKIDVTAIPLPLPIPEKFQFIGDIVLSRLDVIKPAFFHMPFVYISYKKKVNPNKLQGLKAVALKGSASANRIKSLGHKTIEVATAEQVLKVLKSKRADFAPVGLLIYKYTLANTYPELENDFPYVIYDYSPIFFAVRKGALKPAELEQISTNITNMQSTKKDVDIFNQVMKNNNMSVGWLDTFRNGKETDSQPTVKVKN